MCVQVWLCRNTSKVATFPLVKTKSIYFHVIFDIFFNKSYITKTCQKLREIKADFPPLKFFGENLGNLGPKNAILRQKMHFFCTPSPLTFSENHPPPSIRTRMNT